MKRILLLLSLIVPFLASAQSLTVTELGRYTDGRDGACEISAYDAASQRLFTTNAVTDSVDMIDISNPAAPMRIGGMDISTYGGGVNSVVTTTDGYVAVAVEANVKQDSGFVVFFDTAGTYVNQVTVGALPDMLALSPNGQMLLVANEGEPNDDYDVDPEGSIAIIDLGNGIPNLSAADVTLLRFLNAPTNIAGGLKKPGTTYAEDLEPEYIAINDSSTLAAVVCQENNILVLVDLTNKSISGYKGLGFKDHSQMGMGFDASNRDSGINIQNWNVKGVYQPDGIAAFSVNNNDYFISANEGDARDYDGYSSEVRMDDLNLDATAFPNAAMLQEDSVLGRLKTFTADMIGDTDNDGDVDELYSYGARSFSIWDAAGDLVWDSGDDFEQYIAANHSDFFNCNDGLASKADSRSDDKGPEPEAATVGKIGTQVFAFIGLERQGGVMVYDVSDPTNPVFDTFIQSYQGDSTMLDIAPEGLIFVPAAQSHTGKNMLIVSNEVSGTTAIYELVGPPVSRVPALTGKIDVYPNPTTGRVQLALPAGSTEMSYQLRNTLGQELARGLIPADGTTLDLGTAPAGMYFLQVQTREGATHAVRQIIKH